MKKVHTKTVPRSLRGSRTKLSSRKDKNRFIEMLVHTMIGILKILIYQEYRKDPNTHKRSKTMTINNKKTETKGVKGQDL